MIQDAAAESWGKEDYFLRESTIFRPGVENGLVYAKRVVRSNLFLEMKFSCANVDRETTIIFLFSRREAKLARTGYELMFSLLYVLSIKAYTCNNFRIAYICPMYQYQWSLRESHNKWFMMIPE